MRLTFNHLAERELNDAIQYYEHEQPGLGSAFLNEFDGVPRPSLSIRTLVPLCTG